MMPGRNGSQIVSAWLDEQRIRAIRSVHAALVRMTAMARRSSDACSATVHRIGDHLVIVRGWGAAGAIGLVSPSPCGFAQIPRIGGVKMARPVPHRAGRIYRAIMRVAALRRPGRLA